MCHEDESGARELLAEAFAIYAQEGMIGEVSRTLNNMAMSYVREGNYEGAVEQYQELVVWDRRTENLLDVAITMQNMGRIFERNLAQPQMTRKSYLEALAILQQLGEEDQIQAVEQYLKRLSRRVSAGAVARQRGGVGFYCLNPGFRLLIAETLRKGH